MVPIHHTPIIVRCRPNRLFAKRSNRGNKTPAPPSLPPNPEHHTPPHIIPNMPPSKPQLKHFAQQMRNNPTDVEQTSSTALTRPQQRVEPRLNKVDVVSQRIPNASLFHEHETRAVHQAPSLIQPVRIPRYS